MRGDKINRNSRKPRLQSRRVLIVSEGCKTEPNYFKALCLPYKETIRSIDICGNSLSSPSKVVKCAEMLYRKSKRQGNKYDKVFCVFDRDLHGEDDYKNALQFCDNEFSFHAVCSVPCFEYWLLLHLKYTTRGFADCAEVEKDIKEYMPNYDKTSKDIMDCFVTDDKVAEAIINARQNREDAKKTKRKTPMTNVDELVEYLKELNPEKNPEKKLIQPAFL